MAEGAVGGESVFCSIKLYLRWVSCIREAIFLNVKPGVTLQGVNNGSIMKRLNWNKFILVDVCTLAD